jgi:hypothetical protein
MHQVEFLPWLIAANIRPLEFDTAELLILSFGPREIENRFVDVPPHHSSRWADHSRQIKSDVTPAASHVKACHPGACSQAF